MAYISSLFNGSTCHYQTSKKRFVNVSAALRSYVVSIFIPLGYSDVCVTISSLDDVVVGFDIERPSRAINCTSVTVLWETDHTSLRDFITAKPSRMRPLAALYTTPFGFNRQAAICANIESVSEHMTIGECLINGHGMVNSPMAESEASITFVV
jgi:hypothetical protein